MDNLILATATIDLLIARFGYLFLRDGHVSHHKTFHNIHSHPNTCHR
jgi:hypothetical protein